MHADRILAAIQNNALAHAIAKSNHLVIAGLQVVHVIGFVLLLASLALMSLRLLGIVLKDQPIRQVTADPSRLVFTGLILTLASGGLMFTTGPSHYFYNSAFRVKLTLLVAAMLVHLVLYRRMVAREPAVPLYARVVAVVSLMLWFGVGVAGRAIAFV